jgi:hypothetical protein
MTQSSVCLTLWMAATAALPAATITFTGATDGGYVFNYSVSVSNNQRLQTGDYFTIFDFGEYDDPVLPPGWELSEQLNAPNHPTDAPAITNDPLSVDLIVTYMGVEPILGVPGGTDAGSFAFRSPRSGQVSSAYFSSVTKDHPDKPNDDMRHISSGATTVPGALDDASAVPEPASFVLVGSAVAAVWLKRRRRLQ